LNSITLEAEKLVLRDDEELRIGVVHNTFVVDIEIQSASS